MFRRTSGGPMGKAAVSAVAVVALLAGACSDGGSVAVRADSPEAFFVEWVEQLSRGQWEAQWETLHPAHQALVDRNHYVECRKAGISSEADAKVTKIIETEEFDDVSVRGTDESGPATAVTYEVEVSLGPISDKQTDTARIFHVDGEYRWTLVGIDEFQDGACPEEF